MNAELVAGGQIQRDQLRLLERLSLLEATTLILLMGVAVPLKHWAHHPGWVSVLGPLHGLVFVAYVWTVLQTVAGGRWRYGEIARLLLVAVIPLGGYVNLAFVRRKAAEAERATTA